MMAELKTELCGTLILSSDYIDMGEDDWSSSYHPEKRLFLEPQNI
jgi:hypothetical protein